MSLEHDTCPICGEPVKRQNLFRHYKKVHPRRLSSLIEKNPETKPFRRPRIRHPRRIAFYALIILSVTIVSVVAAQIISQNTVRMRITAQLTILIEGAPYTVPANIGMSQGLWKDHVLDRYGVGGSSPLQTRDTTGAIHVESNTVRDFTLHEFLLVWGVSVDPSQVVGNPVQPNEYACTIVNGQATAITDNIILVDQMKIGLEIVSTACSAIS